MKSRSRGCTLGSSGRRSGLTCTGLSGRISGLIASPPGFLSPGRVIGRVTGVPDDGLPSAGLASVPVVGRVEGRVAVPVAGLVGVPADGRVAVPDDGRVAEGRVAPVEGLVTVVDGCVAAPCLLSEDCPAAGRVTVPEAGLVVCADGRVVVDGLVACADGLVFVDGLVTCVDGLLDDEDDLDVEEDGLASVRDDEPDEPELLLVCACTSGMNAAKDIVTNVAANIVLIDLMIKKF